MTPEEINRAIAEALDYTVMQDDSGGGWKLCHPTGATRYPWRDSKEEAWSDCDEYYICLNAMHEAEKVLTQDQIGEYISALIDIRQDLVVFATSPQRAEAFLRTIGKWTE